MSVLVDDIVVAPKEAMPDGVEASLSEGGLKIIGASFGESVKKGTLVKTSVGMVMVDRDPEPRTVVLKLEVRGDAAVTLPEAAGYLERIVGELQERDNWIRRDFHVGGDFSSILYHVCGEVSLNDFAGWQVGECPDVTLTMVCDFAAYSTEETESEAFSTTTARELIYTLPASNGTTKGLKRVQVTNDNASDDWRGLIWAEECVDYKPGDSTALMAYEAQLLTPKGGAEVKEVAGATVVEHAALNAGWLTILESRIGGADHMTHSGPRRIWFRIFDPTPNPEEDPVGGVVQLQLHWRALGSSRWSDGPIVESPLEDSALLNLGEARPQVAILGDERWEWRLLARAPGGSGLIRIQDVYPLPTEQYAVVREPRQEQSADLSSVKGASTAASANEFGGAAWSTPSNATALDGTVTVSGTLEPEEGFSQVLKLTNFGFALPESATVLGLVVNLWKSASIKNTVVDDMIRLVVGGALAGSNRADYATYWTAGSIQQSSYGAANDDFGIDLSFADVNSSTFGIGVAARNISSSSPKAEVDYAAITAYYTQATDDAKVCFATRSLELRSDGVYRQHSTVDVWGPLVPVGFLPYDTPGGTDGRPSRGILIPSQGDLGDLADSGSNKLGTQIFTREGVHYAREGS